MEDRCLVASHGKDVHDAKAESSSGGESSHPTVRPAGPACLSPLPPSPCPAPISSRGIFVQPQHVSKTQQWHYHIAYSFPPRYRYTTPKSLPLHLSSPSVRS